VRIGTCCINRRKENWATENQTGIRSNPSETKIKYLLEGSKPGHLRPNGLFGYKRQSKTRVTKFEVIVAQIITIYYQT
jgi:hypothetical protein